MDKLNEIAVIVGIISTVSAWLILKVFIVGGKTPAQQI